MTVCSPLPAANWTLDAGPEREFEDPWISSNELRTDEDSGDGAKLIVASSD